MEQIKINKLEIENIKRVKAVKIEPTANGLTIIGGNNGQGKTSVLDAISWALGGNKFKPSNPQREGSVIPPNLHIVLSNGLVVERKGKNSDLKVIDPSGQKGGQQLLDSFVEQLALDLPKFMAQTSKEKAQTVLQIIGVGEQLFALEQQEKEIYNQRHAIGQIADQKKKFAEEQIYYPDAPKKLVSAYELIQQQQEVLARNGRNQEIRNDLQDLIHGKQRTETEYKILDDRINELEEKLISLRSEKGMKSSMIKEYEVNIEIAQKTVEELHDESTEELERNIREIDDINRKVRANLDKDKAEEDAKEYEEKYKSLTSELEDVRKSKTELLKNADLPLSGLSVEDGDLIYKGFKWDGMSGSDQLKVATAIVRKLNPKCGFVLLDKLEQMDLTTLKEFGEWLEQEGLQAIATRVSTGDECSIIIEDGYDVKNTTLTRETQVKTWKEGEF